MLHQSSVNDAAAWWVVQSSLLVAQEEPLVDPLVDNDKGDLRSSHSGTTFTSTLWVQLLDCLFELGDLDSDHGVPLSVTHTITVNDEVGGHISAVTLFEGIDGHLESLLQPSVNDLLTTLLDEVL